MIKKLLKHRKNHGLEIFKTSQELVLRNEKVSGSTPLSSTIFTNLR